MAVPGDTVLLNHAGSGQWERRSAGTSNDLWAGTCFANQTCLAVGDSGAILTGSIR
jgi:hypothetical protein